MICFALPRYANSDLRFPLFSLKENQQPKNCLKLLIFRVNQLGLESRSTNYESSRPAFLEYLPLMQSHPAIGV